MRLAHVRFVLGARQSKYANKFVYFALWIEGALMVVRVRMPVLLCQGI